jgi:hypothetical protein
VCRESLGGDLRDRRKLHLKPLGSRRIIPARGTLWRIVLSSVIGTAVEWYDFAIYGTATAPVFNKLFSPTRGASLGAIVEV